MTGETLRSESWVVPMASGHAGMASLVVDSPTHNSHFWPADIASSDADTPAKAPGHATDRTQDRSQEHTQAHTQAHTQDPTQDQTEDDAKDRTRGPAPVGSAGPAPAPPHDWTRRALPRNDFFHQLRHERRRAERSGSPLSLLRYRLGPAKALEWHQVEQMLDALHRCKRETDLVGHLDNEIAVLCPDTGADGSRTLMRKIEAQFAGGSFQAELATYPHDLFESVAASVEPRPAVRPFINPSDVGPEVGYAGKRALDIVVALLAMALLWPLMLLVAIAVAIDSRGPVLFRQQRLGRHAVPFTFYKFRSMVVDGDEGIHRRYVGHLIQGRPVDQPGDHAGVEGQPAPLYKLKADPRVTRVGRYIRMTSLDELPQLFNVLRGDMSLVGPRPPLSYEVAQYQSWHLRRILAVKPGITGLWQVEGRSRVSFNDMVRMDLRYIRRCSLQLDLKILLKTFAVVLRCDGAV